MRVINIYIHLSYFRKISEISSVLSQVAVGWLFYLLPNHIYYIYKERELCVTRYSKQNANFANKCGRVVAHVATPRSAPKRRRAGTVAIKDTRETIGIIRTLATLLVSSFIISTGHLHLPHIHLCFPGEWAVLVYAQSTSVAGFDTLQCWKNAQVTLKLIKNVPK